MTNQYANYSTREPTPEELRARKITSLQQELEYYERNAEEKRKALDAMLNENETPEEPKES